MKCVISIILYIDLAVDQTAFDYLSHSELRESLITIGGEKKAFLEAFNVTTEEASETLGALFQNGELAFVHRYHAELNIHYWVVANNSVQAHYERKLAELNKLKVIKAKQAARAIKKEMFRQYRIALEAHHEKLADFWLNHRKINAKQWEAAQESDSIVIDKVSLNLSHNFPLN